MSKEDKNESIEKKSLTKKVLKIALILIIVFVIICVLPFLYFILVVLYSVFIDVPSKPKIKHGEFPFELVYEYKGEQHTIKDTIVCDYDGYSWSLEGGNTRDWTCEFEKDSEYGQYIIDTINGQDLYIDVPEAADYYMGDKDCTSEEAQPLLMFIDETTGTFYEETDKIEAVDIEIIEWKPSKPLKNNIK
jgi:hypothetical protein